MLDRHGQGHREAHPPAVADLVPDGRATAGLGAGDQAGRRGLLADERRGLRPALLRRPRRAGQPRHRAEGGQAERGLLRGGELLAAARELLPPRDRVHRSRAGLPQNGALPPRRRVRLRRAAAPGAAAAVVGQALPAERARDQLGGARGHRQPRRPRALAAAVEDRDGDLPPQDDPVRLLHDRPRRRGGPQGGPLPPALPRRAVLPDRLLARTQRRPGVPHLAHPRQGRLLQQGRARLLAPRGLRPAHLRHPHRLAAGRHRRHGAGVDLRPHRLAGAAPLRPRGRDRGDRRRRDLRDPVRGLTPAGLLGPGPGRPRARSRPARAGRGGRAAPARGGGGPRGGARAGQARQAPPGGARGGAGRPARRGEHPSRALRAAGHAGRAC